MNLSFFKTVKGKVSSHINIDDYFELIRSNDSDHYIEVERLRVLRLDSPEKYKKEKANMSAVTCSGTFKSGHSKSDLLEHSGLIAIDIDGQDNDKSAEEIKEIVSEDEFTFAAHYSLSGAGVVVLVKINKEKHLESFLGLEKYYANNYNVIIDRSCKDVSRIRFLSYDPDIFINKKSKTFRKYLTKKENYTNHRKIIFGKSDLDYVVKQITSRHINLVNDYSDWVKIGMSLASEGSGNRMLFHAVSRVDSKYNEKQCDRKFDNFLKAVDKISIATFFHIAKENGCELQTEETKSIIQHATIQRRQNKSKDEIIANLEFLEGIGLERSAPIIEQVYNTLPEKSFAANDKKDIIPALLRYVKMLNIRYNEITKHFEYEGEQITDRLLNTVYFDCKQIISPDVNFQDTRKAIESTQAKPYNPVHDYLLNCAEKHKPGGDASQRISDCFTVENLPKKVFYKYLKKWLGGLISSAFGTHSVYILVLQGDQNVRKTSFFEGLLPKELENYCTAYELNDSVDTTIAMSEHWILYDDEYGGKTRKDEKLLKRLSSQQRKKARKAYGHYAENYNRLACLGGTTNEIQIINDPTGNRRIIPIVVDDFDYDTFMSIDKDELFAELYHEWKSDNTFFWFSKQDILDLNNLTQGQKCAELERELFEEYYSAPTGDPFEIVIQMTSSKLLVEIERKSGRKISQRLLGIQLKKAGFTQKIVSNGPSTKRVYEVIEVPELKNNSNYVAPF
jgi:uncharacterized protein YeeX (DUF496 family)